MNTGNENSHPVVLDYRIRSPDCPRATQESAKRETKQDPRVRNTCTQCQDRRQEPKDPSECLLRSTGPLCRKENHRLRFSPSSKRSSTHSYAEQRPTADEPQEIRFVFNKIKSVQVGNPHHRRKTTTRAPKLPSPRLQSPWREDHKPFPTA